MVEIYTIVIIIITTTTTSYDSRAATDFNS